MGLGDLFKAVVNTATLPIDIAVDVISMGEEKRTAEKIEEIAENLNDITKN